MRYKGYVDVFSREMADVFRKDIAETFAPAN